MWFDKLMGFAEQSPAEVRDRIYVDGAAMVSRVNGRSLVCGRLETPSLRELRSRVEQAQPESGQLRTAQVVADVQSLHTDSEFAGAVFQVASQFNLLEMTSPRVTPEQGVGIYDYDPTQGPACAIAAGAGTIYRNYFANVDGHVGQTSDRQIDCSAGLGRRLGNDGHRLWRMSNGYLLPSTAGIEEINERLAAATDAERDELRSELCIGLQWNTEVTLDGAAHCVSQAYCSAVPVSYSELSDSQWEPLARLVLEAAYESTIWASLLPDRIGPSRTLFLTMLGGGAFGNATSWIIDAIDRALTLVQERGYALDVAIVSHRSPLPEVAVLLSKFPSPNGSPTTGEASAEGVSTDEASAEQGAGADPDGCGLGPAAEQGGVRHWMDSDGLG